MKKAVLECPTVHNNVHNFGSDKTVYLDYDSRLAPQVIDLFWEWTLIPRKSIDFYKHCSTRSPKLLEDVTLTWIHSIQKSNYGYWQSQHKVRRLMEEKSIMELLETHTLHHFSKLLFRSIKLAFKPCCHTSCNIKLIFQIFPKLGITLLPCLQFSGKCLEISS